MIYLFENPDNHASVVYDENILTTAEKFRGIAVEGLPVPDSYENKYALLKCRKSTGEVWYEYEDIPPTPESELEQLKQSVLDLTELVLMGGL
jgi:hypothetical protein